MTAEIAAFDFGPQHTVRAVVVDGDPWFVALDVCAALGIAEAHRSLAGLDEDEKGRHSVTTPGGPQMVTTVNEPGLYSLILRSRKPQAKAFKRWVTHEVLPALRKTGRYEVAPLSRRELAEHWADAERRAEVAENRAAELEPSAAAWNVLAAATGDYSVRSAATILARDPKISTGQNRLFQSMRKLGLLDGNNQPYAVHQRHLRLRARSYTHPETGEPMVTQQVRVTVAGLRYLHKRLGGVAALRLDGPEQPELPEDAA